MLLLMFSKHVSQHISTHTHTHAPLSNSESRLCSCGQEKKAGMGGEFGHDFFINLCALSVCHQEKQKKPKTCTLTVSVSEWSSVNQTGQRS